MGEEQGRLPSGSLIMASIRSVWREEEVFGQEGHWFGFPLKWMTPALSSTVVEEVATAGAVVGRRSK